MSIYEREKFLETFQKAKETQRGFDIELALAYPADAISDAAEYVAAGRTSRDDAALVRQAAQDLVVFAEWLAQQVELQNGDSLRNGRGEETCNPPQEQRSNPTSSVGNEVTNEFLEPTKFDLIRQAFHKLFVIK